MGKLVGRGHCLTCPIRPSSLFGCLEESELGLIEDFQTRVVTYDAGEIVYSEGERLNLIYTLRRGFVKLTRFNSEGEAQIVRIVRPGDL
ncbi:MAG: cyclic nucleotide-binding domain-containing protein, partial [Oceanospirillaceae bacterium]|nr:cyclic nucleotide-binding domain-containing protein [Oceanospirillaceae bacterium]